MVPPEKQQYTGICSLLLYFRWTWIGILTFNDENGHRFLEAVSPIFSKSGICIAFIERSHTFSVVDKISEMFEQGGEIHDRIMDSKANVVVAYGPSYSVVFLRWFSYLSGQEKMTNKPGGKVWIMTAQMELTSMVYQRTWDTETIHGSLFFSVHSTAVPGFQQFIANRNPSNTRRDGFIRDFWQQAFACVFPDINEMDGEICTGKEKLEILPEPLFGMHMTGHSYSVYNAAYALSSLLCEITSFVLKLNNERNILICKNYQHILALVFAVKDINENPHLLPNVTLGFQIFDSYFTARNTYHAIMLLIYTLGRFLPNYKCDPQNTLIGVIGGLDPLASLHVATVLDIYKIPQLIYGPAPVMNDKTPGLPFYQMVPPEKQQYTGICSLLLYFRWTWIGILTFNDENGDRFLEAVFPIFSKSGICIAFIERCHTFSVVDKFDEMFEQGGKIHDTVMDSKANVVVAYGPSYSVVFLRWFSYVSGREKMTNKPGGKVWIMTAQMELTSMAYQMIWDAEIIHGSLFFSVHSNAVPGFQQFIANRNPSNSREDGFIRDFWQQAFACVFPDINEVDGEICTGKEKLEILPEPLFRMHMTGHSYSVYNAVYALSYALHVWFSFRLRHKMMANRRGLKFQKEQLWQVMTPQSCGCNKRLPHS
ncbi:hypothetical protein JD844_001683 [Phrynosoma platyrhinos]|uniref:Receptor ligand binding region domain-containing protein n=1 Tax=Phrynosoma platyrhinos TaxID=52577 RepID=A0ABQ7TBT1_PHRPL|nr:hypothetical protein JD844_001683 [Phrynosoma platyrhinos]